MRWCIAFIVLLGCESRPAAPKPAPTERVAPPPVVKRTKPRTETRPATPRAQWTRAETTRTAADWEEAASAYEDELATCACADAAYAVVLARKNALRAAPEDPPPGDDPAPVPPRVQAVVDALDAYVAMADADDPDVPGMKFLAANALYRYRQPDAIARLEAQLRDHPDDETAEYAANTLLDLLMRAGRTDELRTWVTALLADEAFLADRDDLRATLLRLREALAT